MTDLEKNGRVVTRAEIATLCSVSLPTVDAWLRKGCPVIERGSKGKPAKFSTTQVINWRIRMAAEEGTSALRGVDGRTTKDEAARRRGVANMLTAEFETEILLRSVVSRADAETAMAEFCQPTETKARTYGGEEVAPMLRATPVLASMLRPNRKGHKPDSNLHFTLTNGASIRLVGAAVDDSLRQYSARFKFADELDAEGWIPGVKSQGDKLTLLLTRGQTYYNRKQVRGSIPVLEETSRITGSRIRIEVSVPEVPCFVNADPSQFDTSLVNLAINARDAMGGEGTLTIRVGTAFEIPPLHAQSVVEGDFVTVSVGDTGIGIPPENLERIFEPFYTTKGVGQGTGLGLSQVIGFVKQSGGDVAVESEQGQGATFTLYLPRVSETGQIAKAPGDHSLVEGHGISVLVVEDNADVGSFATISLRELGYATVLAPDADHALAELARSADRFDVVFSDVVMPGMSGIELGQEIRRLHADLPVVLTSGYSHVLAQNGTYGFELLHKPYSIEQLSRILAKAARWRKSKRPAA